MNKYPSGWVHKNDGAFVLLQHMLQLWLQGARQCDEVGW